MEVGAIKELTNTLWQLRKQRDEVKKQSSELQAQLDDVEGKLIAIMEEEELDRFDGDFCSIFVNEKSSVKVPKDPESRGKLFEYLRGRGLFDDLITINSATLNSWYKAEEEIAIEKKDLNFRIPGLETPTPYTTLNVRAKK